jgi:hypothetical protein
MKQLDARVLNNYITVNTTQTVAMSFHLCQSKPSYKPNILLQNTEITSMSEVQFLAMYITESVIWRAHIHSLCLRLSKTCYMIKP